MQISDLPKVMIICLLETIFIEVLVAIILKYHKKDIINIILVNILTNPLLNSFLIYINYNYGLKVRKISLIIMEIMVVIIEGYIYKKYLDRKKINPYLLSFILNLSSYLIGTLINYLIY